MHADEINSEVGKTKIDHEEGLTNGDPSNIVWSGRTMLRVQRPLRARIEPHLNIAPLMMSMKSTADSKVGLGHKCAGLTAESFLHSNNVQAALDKLFPE